MFLSFLFSFSVSFPSFLFSVSLSNFSFFPFCSLSELKNSATSNNRKSAETCVFSQLCEDNHQQVRPQPPAES